MLDFRLPELVNCDYLNMYICSLLVELIRAINAFSITYMYIFLDPCYSIDLLAIIYIMIRIIYSLSFINYSRKI